MTDKESDFWNRLTDEAARQANGDRRAAVRILQADLDANLKIVKGRAKAGLEDLDKLDDRNPGFMIDMIDCVTGRVDTYEIAAVWIDEWYVAHEAEVEAEAVAA